MPLAVTPLYAALLTVLYILLSLRVVGRRHAAQVSLGDGGDKRLLGRIRAHDNCAEYVPLGLFLLLLAELSGAPVWGLHLAGASLVAGRLAHAWALSGPGGMAFRVGGMALTFTALILAAALALFA